MEISVKERFDEVIRYSQHIRNPETNEIFSTWAKNKVNFVKAFGGLIYEYPEKVSFELSEKEKHERVIQFANRVYERYGYYDLSQFIEQQEQGFFNNLTISDTLGWDGSKIQKGSKLVKAFRHFINPESKSLEDIQNEASRIIQENKIEGTLCLSVHPLDFLSLSENTYNWLSCHSLDGDYRAGNISYMMDKVTFICYLRGEKETQIPNFGPNVPWNSKKWRTLLHMSDDGNLLMAGRSYPFESQTALDIVLHNVLPKVGICKEDWSNWNSHKIFNVVLDNELLHFRFPYLPVAKELIPLNEIVLDEPDCLQYTDLLYSHCYSPIYAFKKVIPLLGDKYPATTKDTKIRVGHSVPCLHCGEANISRGNSTFMCDNCELEYGETENDNITTCDYCGRRQYQDNLIHVYSDDWFVCQHCIDEYYCVCSSCGEYIHRDNIKFDEDSQTYVCEECLEDIIDWRKENGSQRYYC